MVRSEVKSSKKLAAWRHTYKELLAKFPAGKTPRPAQIAALKKIDAAFRKGKRFVVMEMPTGCHAAGQLLLMFDGSTKKVEDVHVGDLLMGPDSRPREVLCLIRGVGNLTRITPTKGEPWVVNDDHVLTLVRTNTRRRNVRPRKDVRDGEIVDVPVSQWRSWSRTRKHNYKLFRAPADFAPRKPLPVDPYLLGIILGDGCLRSGCATISKPDEEVHTAIATLADRERVDARRSIQRPELVSLSRRGHSGPNPMTEKLKKLALWGLYSGERFIPFAYKVASRVDRLKILAGLLDTDGYYGHGFDYISKSRRLSEDVAFVARSVGLAAYVSPCSKFNQDGVGGTYFRVSLSGELDLIPTKIKRKQAASRRQKKSVVRTGFREDPIGLGEYYGFTLTNDGRYLLGDFTVTHNSGKSFIAKAAADVVAPDGGAYMITAQKALQEQYQADFPAPQMELLKGRANYACTHPDVEAGMNAGKAVCHKHSRGILRECVDVDDTGPREDSVLQAATRLDLPPNVHLCPYWKQLQLCNDSALTLFNFSSFLFQRRMGRFQKRSLLLLDEGHNIEGQLVNFVSLELTEWTLDIINVKIDRQITTKGMLLDWLREKEVSALIDAKLGELDEDGQSLDKDLRDMEKDALTDLKGKLGLFLKYIDKTEWIFETVDYRTRRGDPTRKIQARPLFAKDFAEDLLFRHADRVIVFSATILNVPLWAKNLDIDTTELAHIETPCDFPVENRPIHLEYCGNMGRKHFSREMNPRNPTQPKFVAKVKQILERHKGQRGLIHTHSFALSDVLRREVASPRFLFQADFGGDKQLMMSALASTPDGVIVAPAMSEGFDFRDDLARWQIIAKVPWPSLGDKIIKERANRDDTYFGWLTALKLVQSYGRAVRSKKDWGYTYILDSGFNFFFGKHGHMIPGWFKEAVSRYAPKRVRREVERTGSR